MKKFLAVLLTIFIVLSLSGCSGILSEMLYELNQTEYEGENQTETKVGDNISKEDFPLLVHFLDVGQADSTFCELPDGKTMLIDAGNPENASDVIEYIENLGYSRIDYVVATHPHADHIGGMAEVLDKLKIGKVFMPKKEHTSSAFEKMIDVIAEKEIPLYTAKKGAVIAENEEYEINILSPEEKEYDNLNNYSAVIKLTYGESKFLFMGDAEREIETPLKKLDIRANILKLGHHGSSTSSGQEFLNMVSPGYVVISCGKDNSYGHPHEEVIKRLNRLGKDYGRTDICGTITIGANDKQEFVIEKENPDGN